MSWAMLWYAGIMAAAVNVPMQAWKATRARLVDFFISIFSLEREKYLPERPVVGIGWVHAGDGVQVGGAVAVEEVGMVF